jgi:serine/threonine-protein kinase haspin
MIHLSVTPLDSFLVSQTYAIIVLPNGGLDLEAYKFVNASKMGWRQSCSLFWQVAKALAHAEQLVSFEVGKSLFSTLCFLELI